MFYVKLIVASVLSACFAMFVLAQTHTPIAAILVIVSVVAIAVAVLIDPLTSYD